MELNITTGTWATEQKSLSEITIHNETIDICTVLEMDIEPTEAEANALLIANAGTTANRCGLLPSELLAQRDDLLKVAEKCRGIADRCNNAGLPKHVQELLKAIEGELLEAIVKTKIEQP